jgi:hypothetical protein
MAAILDAPAAAQATRWNEPRRRGAADPANTNEKRRPCALSNKRIRLPKAKTSEKNPGKLDKPTDCLPDAPAAQISSPSDAREALGNGSIAGIGRYLRDDVARLLRLLAERRHRQSQSTTKPPGYDPDVEFEFDTADIIWAIEGHLSSPSRLAGTSTYVPTDDASAAGRRSDAGPGQFPTAICPPSGAHSNAKANVK